jgi:hypothetical protein
VRQGSHCVGILGLLPTEGRFFSSDGPFDRLSQPVGLTERRPDARKDTTRIFGQQMTTASIADLSHRSECQSCQASLDQVDQRPSLELQCLLGDPLLRGLVPWRESIEGN